MEDREKAIDDIAANIRGYASLRYDVMKLADEENDLRLKLIEVQSKKNAGITALVECADRLFTKGLSEHNPDGSMKKGYEYEKSPVHGAAMVEVIAEATNPKSRHCSNCGEAGHTARTCTNERKEKEEPEAPKEKVKRKLSPERKAQLAETLKKARAARTKKGGKK